MSRGPGVVERQLLELEGASGEAFCEAVCRVTGADRFLLFAPSGGAGHRLVLSNLPAGAAKEALRNASLDPVGHPLLFQLSGRLSIAPGSPAQAPFGGYFPEARWVMAGVGESWSFSALLFGSGAPPTQIANDPLLAGALLCRLGEQAGAGPSGARAAVEVLSRLSHEFKTPLVSIKGYAELLLDQNAEPLSPKLRDWVRRIAGGANRLSALYRKATAEARTEVGWSYEPRPVEPAPWVRSCLDEASALALGRKLAWKMDVEAGLSSVALDPEAGRDLLLELFQNAARSTPDGGEVTVSARAEARDGRSGVRITVEDTGVGIPGGQAAEHLFERFATLTHALQHHSGDFEFGAGGLGLGLALVRGVARAHGGCAWAEGTGRDSVRLPGSAFHVWLPAFRGEVEPAPPATEVRGRLLVIEPDPEVRRILEASLSESFELVSAGTAAEALERWRDGAWDACLVEPRISGGGAELIRELRSQPGAEGRPIIAYTSAGAREAAAWRAAGADSCVSKPARARLLLQRLRALSPRKARP